jgi:hypothetical protein
MPPNCTTQTHYPSGDILLLKEDSKIRLKAA